MKSFLILMLGLTAIAVAQRPGWNFQSKVVTGAPYSATGVTTRTQTLTNGNTINQSSCTNYYRDSSGRTRREETRNSATCSSTPTTVFINDPVAGISYVINPANNTYRQFTIKTPASSTTSTPPTPPTNPNTVTTTPTPASITVSGITADGTETVTTIPAGRFGNTQPITITSTRYYSPTLQIVVQSTRTDPRSGTTSFALSNISTAEPAESLFELPAGLTLQQGPAGRFRRAR